jgi:hypothetical protein
MTSRWCGDSVERAFDAPLKFTGRREVERRRPGCRRRPERQQLRDLRFVREPVAASGPVQIARDCEEPRSHPRVGSQRVRVPHQPEPRFVQQILGERSIPAHPQQEPENPRTIGAGRRWHAATRECRGGMRLARATAAEKPGLQTRASSTASSG